VPLTKESALLAKRISCVFIHCWPKESALSNLCMCAECPIMSSIWWWMASLNDFYSFFNRYTSPEQAIWADSEEVRFISYVSTTFLDEFPFVCSWWYIS
jgi:hypothetical protein